jgi:hypothetical protein
MESPVSPLSSPGKEIHPHLQIYAGDDIEDDEVL